MSLPPDIQRVINARADDAIKGIFRSVQQGDREALYRYGRELVNVLEDEHFEQEMRK